MTASASAAARELAGWLGALAVLKLVLGIALLETGFHGISDDDFARVVIAQRFAEAPALDPSGTSWLPLPFWVYGTAFCVSGPSLAVARETAVLLSVLATWVLFAAGRALGLSARASALGAAIASVFPYSAYLGVATVPEVPAAALTVFGAATLTRPASLRWLGALALGGACASRYEPWAAAAAFSAVCAWQALRTRNGRLLGPALVALGFPLLWLLHGVVRHGDALFFVGRVTAYRAALGLAPTALPRALLTAPLALVTQEPELAGALFAVLVFRRFFLPRAPSPLSLFSVPLAAVLILLMLGDARGSAPTHHGERALLPIWFGFALRVAGSLSNLPSEARLRATLTALTTAVTALVGLRPLFPRDPFAARQSELALGASARALGVERLAIDTPDFGFFAVQAAFGQPSKTHVFRDHDPRKARAPDAHAQPPLTLAEFARAHAARWLALPLPNTSPYGGRAVLRATHAPLALIELTTPRGSPERADSGGPAP